MACNSLVALPRACGAEGNVAGLEKLYVVSFADLATVSGSTEVYAASTTGLVNEIGLAVGKKFVEVGLLKSTSGLKQALTKNLQQGSAFFTQTFTLVLSGLTQANKTFLEAVLNQPIAIIFKTRMRNFYVVGLNGQFELSAAQVDSGVTESELSGYNLTFSGIDTISIQQVDESIVSGLIS